MGTKDIAIAAGFVLMFAGLIGSQFINVFDTGKELTCATNKPYGWDIITDKTQYVEAVCPYLTKTPIYANCSSTFRSTKTYLRYGCQEVYVVVEDPVIEPPVIYPNDTYIPIPGSKVWHCNSKTCERIE
jgi:hypothetical protein